ncbi:MAG: YiiD C-terminal domain-containing protein [Thermomonas sp.]
MPPVAAMQPQVLEWRDGMLCLGAPLAANVNDKGCAFGGSLCSLMTIAGWGIGFLQLAEAGLDADIYVADSRIRYLKPVYEDLRVEARLDIAGEGAADALDLAGALRARGRVNFRVESRAPLADGGVAAVLGARYVAIAR